MHSEFTSRVAGQSCPPELEAQIAADMNLVVRNMGNVFEFRGVVASSEPAKARPSIDMARAIPADQKRRIDFYTSRGDAWRMKNDYEKAIADFAVA
jgi:hypothetical protein